MPGRSISPPFLARLLTDVASIPTKAELYESRLPETPHPNWSFALVGVSGVLSTRRAHASSRCSQLSSTSNERRSLRCSTRTVNGSRPKARDNPRATRIASRVLPTPPAPPASPVCRQTAAAWPQSVRIAAPQSSSAKRADQRTTAIRTRLSSHTFRRSPAESTRTGNESVLKSRPGRSALRGPLRTLLRLLGHPHGLRPRRCQQSARSTT